MVKFILRKKWIRLSSVLREENVQIISVYLFSLKFYIKFQTFLQGSFS